MHPQSTRASPMYAGCEELPQFAREDRRHPGQDVAARETAVRDEGGGNAHEVSRSTLDPAPRDHLRSDRGRARRRGADGDRARRRPDPSRTTTPTSAARGKANPKLSPVVIGAINTQGGQVLVGPGWTKGVRTAVQYVNRYLGGVQGHPLVVSYCFTTSAEEEGTKCGQKFANDKRIKVVEFGAVAVGNQSFYAALGNNKPTVGGVELLPGRRGAQERLRAVRDERLGPRAVGHVRQGRPARRRPPRSSTCRFRESTTARQVEKDSLESAGIKTTLVGFDPNATDLTGPLTAAGAQNADMIVPQTPANGCVAVAKALAQLGKSSTPVVSNPLCLTPEVAQGLGGDLAKWDYGIASSLGFDTQRPGSAAVHQGPEGGRPAEAGGRRLGDRRLGPDPDDGEADEPDRRRRA